MGPSVTMLPGGSMAALLIAPLSRWQSAEMRVEDSRYGLLLCLGVTAAGCTDTPTEHVGRSVSPMAVPGPWRIPDEVLAVGDTQDVLYTGAGNWLGEQGCFGDISPGTQVLREYLYAHFPQTYTIGGYACRPIVGNESKMSVHATGRALDVMLHTIDGEADNTLGDPIGHWLIVNAEAIGIQLVIWDLYSWGAHREPGQKGRDYGGSHPHHDHLHIELASEYEHFTENWFADQVTPPTIIDCPHLPAEGGIVDERSPCFGAYGPSQFWRVVEGAGHDDGLLWTNAFENDEPSNWARWNLYLENEGDFEVEVFIDPEYGVNRKTTYALRHALDEDGFEAHEIIIDQGAASGWVSLGTYPFDEGERQHLSVHDNVDGSVDDDQHIAVDAVRLTRVVTEGGAGGIDRPGAPPFTVERPDQPAGDDGGCSLASTRRLADGWWLLLALGVLARRRHAEMAE